MSTTTPAAPANAAVATPVSDAAWEALKGGYDLQVHVAPDVIERQLAHVERNKTRAAYNRSTYLPERRTMMQQWADMLDGFRHDSNVIPIQRRA